MEETLAGCRATSDGARDGEGTAVEGTASAASHAERRLDEETTEAAGREDAVRDAAHGGAAEEESDEAKTTAPHAGMAAAASEAMKPEAMRQAAEAAAEKALSAKENVGTAAARATAERAANLGFDASTEVPRTAALAADEAMVGGAETSAAEREKATPARLAAATARGEAAADEGAHEVTKAEASVAATAPGGSGAAAAGSGSEVVRAGGQSAVAEEPLITTEAAAPAGARGAAQTAAQALPGTAAQGETRLTERIVPGGEAVAGKEATAVTEELTAIRERATLETASRPGEAARSAVTEEAVGNEAGTERVVEEESALRQFRRDVAARVLENALATAEGPAGAGEETTAIATPQSVAPPRAGEVAEAFQACTAAAEVAGGSEGGGPAVVEGREEPEDVQYGSAAPAVTSKMTGAFLEAEAGIAGAAVCHSTDAACAINSEAVSAAAMTGAAAAAPLVNIVGSGTRVDFRETAAALIGDGSAETVFDGGDPVSAFSLAAAAASSTTQEAEAAVAREGGIAGEWTADSTALNGEGAPWRAAVAAYEVDASGGFAECAESGASTSFAGVPQQPIGVDTSSYSSSSENIDCSYNGSAGGSGSTGLTGGCSGGENSNELNVNSTYDNGDDGGGGGGGRSWVELMGSCGSNSSAAGSGSSVDLVDNYVRSDCSSGADGGRSCVLGQQYYAEGDTQQVCTTQDFSGSTGDEGAYSSSCAGGVEYGSSGGSGGYSNSVDCGGSSLAYGSSSAGLEPLTTGEMTAETSGGSSSGLPIEGVADCSALPYPDTSSSDADYYGGLIFDDSAAAAGIGEAVHICNGILDARWGVEAEQESEQLRYEDEDEFDSEKEEDQTETKQPWRGVLGTNDLLTERDNDILQLLADDEPPIPDELCRYFLHRVGCAATDRTVARLVSIAAQLQLERVMDDAKVFAFCMQRRGSTGSTEDLVEMRDRSDLMAGALDSDESLFRETTPDDMEDLDLGSLCGALQKSDDTFSGLSLDCFLDAAPVFMPALTGTSGAADPEEPAATIPVSPTAYPATVAEHMVNGGEAESRTVSGVSTPLGAIDYAALPYPVALQSSFSDLQSTSLSSIPLPCDAVTLNAALLQRASHADPLYAAALEAYDLPSLPSSVNPASFAAVSRVALHSADATGEMPSVLTHNSPFLASSGPVTVDDTYRAVDATLRDAPAAMPHTDASDFYPMNMEVAGGLPAGTTAVNTEVAPDAAVDMGADAAAGVMPACIDNTVPLVGIRSTPNDLVSAAGASPAAGMMFDPRIGMLHALPGVASFPSPVLEGGMPLAAEGMQVTGPSADASAGELRPLPVDMSAGAVGAPAGDIAADGLSAGDAGNGSVLGAGMPLFLSALNAPAQSSTAVAASIVPPAAADDVAATYPPAAGESSAHTPFSGMAPSACVEDVETVRAGAVLVSTTSSSASAGADAPDSVTTRSLGTEAAAGLASETTARFPVESAVLSEPLGFARIPPVEPIESTDSTSQRREPTLQTSAAAVRAATAPARETTAIDNEASGTHQSTRNSVDTDILQKL